MASRLDTAGVEIGLKVFRADANAPGMATDAKTGNFGGRNKRVDSAARAPKDLGNSLHGEQTRNRVRRRRHWRVRAVANTGDRQDAVSVGWIRETLAPAFPSKVGWAHRW
jgi:hypothetical protein